MTVTIEHAAKRKGSWDSKVSHGSRAGTPSSILSSDSDIRFTRQLGSNYRCGCGIVAAFLVFLLLAAVAVYFASTLLGGGDAGEQAFVAAFRVSRGAAWTPALADPASDAFRLRARFFREAINLVLRRSALRHAFLAADVLALDGMEGQYLIVHFNMLFDPSQEEVTVPKIDEALRKHFTAEGSPYFANLTIDPNSLEIKESTAALTSTLAPTTPTTRSPPLTTTPPPPRKCGKIELRYCADLPYNITSYPNILGHSTIQDVQDNVIPYRELIDAECYRLAYDFVCQLLQPACKVNHDEVEDNLILPCRDYCEEFVTGCGSRLPETLREILNCTNFPKYTSSGSCILKPGCLKDLHTKGMSSRICDGVADCADLSDEINCPYCSTGNVHCGTEKVCIPREKLCDGIRDCPNGNDELHCLFVSPKVNESNTARPQMVFDLQYFTEGFVVQNEKGKARKLCTANLATTVPEPDRLSTLNTIASSVCKQLSYQTVDHVRMETDIEVEQEQYVHLEDPTSSISTFVEAPCPQKQVLHVRCSNVDCGHPVYPSSNLTEDLKQVVKHGERPWHAALFKDGVHVCDGTLVSDQWVLTTASCFQGQPKAEWIVRLGSVRLSASPPWQQVQRVIGMVKSPVEGSTVALVKLESQVIQSDFVRSICLPEDRSLTIPHDAFCITLGWGNKREELQQIQLKHGSMQLCMNISFPTVNSFCTEPTYVGDDCSEEELAGSSIVCRFSGSSRWVIMGITNWRIACSKLGVQRPRLYDKIVPNIDWIRSTIESIS